MPLWLFTVEEYHCFILLLKSVALPTLSSNLRLYAIAVTPIALLDVQVLTIETGIYF